MNSRRIDKWLLLIRCCLTQYDMLLSRRRDISYVTSINAKRQNNGIFFVAAHSTSFLIKVERYTYSKTNGQVK